MDFPDDPPLDGAARRDAARTTRGMGKGEYVEIRSRLDFRPNIAPTIAVLAFGVLLMAAILLLLRCEGVGPFLLSQLLLAIFFFNNFSLMHECGHGAAARSPIVNTLVGHYSSTFCFIPYYPWKYIHQKHHLWAGNMERDPVLKSLKSFRDNGVPPLVRLAWRSWIPLSALLQHVVYLGYPYVMWRAGEMTRTKLLRTAASVAWMPLSWGGLWLLAPDVVRPSNFLLGFALFLFSEELVNLPHHFGMPTFDGKLPPWEQYRTTRSCYYPYGISELFVLNFNFHIEHHLFPTLPWYRLRTARTLILAKLGDSYTECAGVSWNVENRLRDIDRIVAPYRERRVSEAE